MLTKNKYEIKNVQNPTKGMWLVKKTVGRLFQFFPKDNAQIAPAG